MREVGASTAFASAAAAALASAAAAAAITSARAAPAARLAVHGAVLRVDAALPGVGLLTLPADLEREGALRASGLLGLFLARGHPGVLLHRHLARQAFAPERLAASPGMGLALLHERALVGGFLVLARFQTWMRRRRPLAVRIVARGWGALPSNGPRRHLALGRVRVRAVVADGVILAHGHRRVRPRRRPADQIDAPVRLAALPGDLLRRVGALVHQLEGAVIGEVLAFAHVLPGLGVSVHERQESARAVIVPRRLGLQLQEACCWARGIVTSLTFARRRGVRGSKRKSNPNSELHR